MAPRKPTPIAPVTPDPDPTLPFYVITIQGKEYKMVFQHKSLAHAEDVLRSKGYDVNLLGVYLNRTFSNVRVLFAASLLAYQPEFPFEEALDLVDNDTIIPILVALSKAWDNSMPVPDPDAANPPPPTP
jgi:hypothetical protein